MSRMPPIPCSFSRTADTVSSSAEDWTQSGDLRIVELPNFADLSMESKDPYGRDMDQWPLYRLEGAHAMMHHIDGYIGYARARGYAFPVFLFPPLGISSHAAGRNPLQ